MIGCGWAVQDVEDLDVLLVPGKQAVAHDDHSLERGKEGDEKLDCGNDVVEEGVTVPVELLEVFDEVIRVFYCGQDKRLVLGPGEA